MATKKQRKRREKEHRHEYELVVVDETGEERPLDSDELRKKRLEKEAERDKGKKPGAKPQSKAAGGRPIKEVQPPSLNRVWKRVVFFGLFMFLVLSFLGGKNEPIGARIALTVVYTALFIPFIYLMDRVQYRQYLRRTGQPEPPKAGRAARGAADGSKPKAADASSGAGAKTGLGLFRGRRR